MRNPTYEAAKLALAKLLAEENNQELSVYWHNEAARILWPLLSQETQSSLVLR